jgi:three-Cys-motif partner protein
MYNLEKINNPQCRGNCSKQERKTFTESDVCSHIKSVVDNGPVRCVGEWAEEKIERLVKYYGIFTSGMKNKWTSLNYIEVCSGPGRCIFRETKKEVNGTSLQIIESEGSKYIGSALFFDFNQNVVDALNLRFQNRHLSTKARAIYADYHDFGIFDSAIDKYLKQNALNLVFIDPTDCSLPFEFIEKIKTKLGKVDFIINFAFGTDMNRNIKNALTNESWVETKEKYENFLGISDLSALPDILKFAQHNDPKWLSNLLLKRYQERLNEIGLIHVDSVKIRHYYYLIFATGHERGLKFWHETTKVMNGGQTNLLGDLL